MVATTSTGVVGVKSLPSRRPQVRGGETWGRPCVRPVVVDSDTEEDMSPLSLWSVRSEKHTLCPRHFKDRVPACGFSLRHWPTPLL